MRREDLPTVMKNACIDAGGVLTLLAHRKEDEALGCAAETITRLKALMEDLNTDMWLRKCMGRSEEEREFMVAWSVASNARFRVEVALATSASKTASEKGGL
jgi:hypothetical protein